MTSSEPPKPSYDHFIKMIIIGNSGVGKTNILLRFCDEKYKESHVATVGVDFKIKTVLIGEKHIKLQMWDTAGQERYRNLTNNYYKGAAGIVLVYSMDNRKSFEDIEVWVKQINENTHCSSKKVLIASKSDLAAERKVTEHEGRSLAEVFGMDYWEVSAKEDVNIKEMMMHLTQKVVKDLAPRPLPDFSKEVEQLKSDSSSKAKSSLCC